MIRSGGARLFWLAVVVAVTISASARADLVSRWEADGDAQDSVGSNDGVLANGVGFVPGKFGQAFSFNGTGGLTYGQSVRVPDSTSLDIASTWTLSAWIYTTDLTDHAGNGQGIISKVGGLTGNYGYQFGLLDDSDGKASLFIQFNTAGGGWPMHSLTAGDAVSKDTWAFVAASFDGTSLRLYADGSPLNSMTVSDPPKSVANSASYFRIALDDNGNVPFEGYIDRVSVYNHTLSDGEISALYQEEVVPVPGAFALVGFGLGFAGWLRGRRTL